MAVASTSRVSRPVSRPPRPAGARGSGGRPPKGGSEADHEILFQQFFKSVGPRTYAAQVKRAGNGNHYLVLTEGKRDEKTGEVRKVRLFLFSEDFVEFFKLMKGTAEFIKAHPLPDEVKRKREKFWAKQAAEHPARPLVRRRPLPRSTVIDARRRRFSRAPSPLRSRIGLPTRNGPP